MVKYRKKNNHTVMAQYTKEQYWAIYEKLPQELKEAVFSNEVAEHIATACERNNVQEMSQVAAAVGDVLMGVTKPSDFQQALQKEVGLQLSVAQAVAQELNRFVFYPVKAQLEDIHRVPAEQPERAKDIGVATPRHEGERRTATPPEPQPEDDYLIAEEAEQRQEEEIVEQPNPQESDQYREKPE